MADRETISDVVAAYGRILGLSNLTLDQDGQCHLQFDERLPVSLAVADEGEELVAVAAVGELGPPRRRRRWRSCWTPTSSVAALAAWRSASRRRPVPSR